MPRPWPRLLSRKAVTQFTCGDGRCWCDARHCGGCPCGGCRSDDRRYGGCRSYGCQYDEPRQRLPCDGCRCGGCWRDARHCGGCPRGGCRSYCSRCDGCRSHACHGDGPCQQRRCREQGGRLLGRRVRRCRSGPGVAPSHRTPGGTYVADSCSVSSGIWGLVARSPSRHSSAAVFGVRRRFPASSLRFPLDPGRLSQAAGWRARTVPRHKGQRSDRVEIRAKIQKSVGIRADDAMKSCGYHIRSPTRRCHCIWLTSRSALAVRPRPVITG